jgi:U3 small nucleolar RNA-associated protein 21
MLFELEFLLVIMVSKKIFEFSGFGSPVTFLEQSPVIDIVAVGLLDGTIALHNLKTDNTLMKFHQEGRVTSISFRTGND